MFDPRWWTWSPSTCRSAPPSRCVAVCRRTARSECVGQTAGEPLPRARLRASLVTPLRPGERALPVADVDAPAPQLLDRHLRRQAVRLEQPEQRGAVDRIAAEHEPVDLAQAAVQRATEASLFGREHGDEHGPLTRRDADTPTPNRSITASATRPVSLVGNPGQPAMADRAADQAAQHVPALDIGRQHAVGDQERRGAEVVADDPSRRQRPSVGQPLHRPAMIGRSRSVSYTDRRPAAARRAAPGPCRCRRCAGRAAKARRRRSAPR